MDNENARSMSGISNSDADKLNKLEMLHEKLKKECDFWFDKQLVLSARLSDSEQNIMKAKLKRDNLTKILEAKEAEDKRLTEAIQNLEQSNHNLRFHFDVKGYADKVLDQLNNFNAMDLNYNEEQILDDTEKFKIELQFLDKEVEDAVMLYEKMCAEDQAADPLKLDNVFEILEDTLKYKEDLENKVETLKKKIEN